MKRLYSEVATYSHPPGSQDAKPQPSPGAHPPKVADQLAKVAERLLQVTSQSATTHGDAAHSAAASGMPGGNPPTAQPPPRDADLHTPSRQQLQQGIKQLESALQHLTGDDVGETKAHLLAQIENKKRQLVEARPIGQRIDNTRAALERARKRSTLTQEALTMAHAAAEAAAVEESRIAAELADLEASINNGPVAMETGCVASLEEHLLAAVGQLR